MEIVKSNKKQLKSTKEMGDRSEEKFITGSASLKVPNTSYGQYTLDRLRANAVRIAQIDGQTGQVLTTTDLLEKSVKLAVVLEDKGIRVGDTISISAENHMNYFIAACAAFYRGAVLAPMNPAYTESEIIHCLNIAKPKIIFVSRRSEKLICEAIKSLPCQVEILELDDVPVSRDIVTLKSILDETRDWPNPQYYNAAKIEHPEKQVTLLHYSSGTTGLPKGVMLTHYNILLEETALGQPDFLNFRETDVVLTILPFFHGYGMSMVMQLFHVGGTAITMTSFEPERYLANIGKYRVTFIPVVPPMMNFFAKHPMISRYDYSSLREILCGGAPLLPEARRDALRRLGNPVLRNAYGMTELSIIISVSERHMKKPDSVGILVPGISCKVVDLKTMKSVGPGETGEMCFKGDYLMLGYKDNAKATEETIDKDGWLHSGDLGYYDEDGDLFIVGRLKELIKYKAFQVSPSEIESLLLSHPDITDAAVVGKPDDDAGELPMAFIVKRPGSSIVPEEVLKYINERVSPQSKIRGGVHIVQAIPKNPSGKILRRVLQVLVSKL